MLMLTAQHMCVMPRSIKLTGSPYPSQPCTCRCGPTCAACEKAPNILQPLRCEMSRRARNTGLTVHAEHVVSQRPNYSCIASLVLLFKKHCIQARTLPSYALHRTVTARNLP